MPITAEQFYEMCVTYGIDLDGDYSRDQAEMTRDMFWFMRAIERAARAEAIGECEAIAAEDYIRGEEIAQRIRALLEGK